MTAILARDLAPGDRVRSVDALSPLTYAITSRPRTESGVTHVRGTVDGGAECDLVFLAAAELGPAP